MQALRVVPTIHYFDTFKEFNEVFCIGKRDVLVTNQWMFDPYVKPLGIDTNVLFQERFGSGEPSDEMIDKMAAELKQYDYDRIIAFGGGTIVDSCKVLCLDVPEHSVDLFTGAYPPKKCKRLVVVPTTCGTGSEVTNVAVVELKSLHTKKGLAVEETYADDAVLVPESLGGLPDTVFATSSVDALIHAIEAYLSPKASAFTELYSLEAIRMIMEGYKKILSKGNTKESRAPFLREFALASNYAGIAFGNAGCGAVHALSYCIGAAFHVPHGEANYRFLTEVFRMYMRKEPNGKIQKANQILADILGCDVMAVYDELETFLGQMIPKKTFREYGMHEGQIDEFTDSTIQNQQRLLANNYVDLNKDELREIIANLY